MGLILGFGIYSVAPVISDFKPPKPPVAPAAPAAPAA
jgi:hypothetical protein